MVTPASCPTARIKQIGIPHVQREYAKHCPYPLLTLSHEFSQKFKNSGCKSRSQFANTLGLNRAALDRLIACKSLPTSEKLWAAVELGRTLYGPPDHKRIREAKRSKAIQHVLSALGLIPSSFSDPASGFKADQVDVLVNRLDVPDHHTLSCPKNYKLWVDKQQGLYPDAGVVDLDAAGHFFAAREWLQGFARRLIESADYVASKQGCENAQALLKAMKEIQRCIPAFLANGQDFRAIRKELSPYFGSRVALDSADDEAFLRHITEKWELEIEHFVNSRVTLGYLVMESKILRPLALGILR